MTIYTFYLCSVMSDLNYWPCKRANLGLVEITMDSVFATFKATPWFLIHDEIGFKQSASCWLTYSKVLPATKIVESSANIFNLWGSSISKEKSFINVIKRRGPKMFPCGTPREMSRNSEAVPLTWLILQVRRLILYKESKILEPWQRGNMNVSFINLWDNRQDRNRSVI